MLRSKSGIALRSGNDHAVMPQRPQLYPSVRPSNSPDWHERNNRRSGQARQICALCGHAGEKTRAQTRQQRGNHRAWAPTWSPEHL